MAFNPFHAFRKHQKVIFAVLTIVCMFVFILTGFGGRSDPVSNLLAAFGFKGRSPGEKVVTLYGRDLTGADLERMRTARQLANEFVVQALNSAAKSVAEEVKEYKPEQPDQTDQDLLDVRQSWNRRISMPESLQQLVEKQFMTMQQASQQLRMQMAQFPQQIRQDFARLSEIEQSLAAANGDKSKADDQIKLIAGLRCLLRQEYYDYTAQLTPLYFGGGVKTEDMLDFEVWKHQADQLGVVLTKADARRALAHLGADRDPPADPGGSWRTDPVFKDLFARRQQQQQQQPLKEEDVVTAVVDEFRVLIAKDLLGGQVTGVPGADAADRIVPDPASPYGFWKFYRDNRTTLKVAFLPIPVDAFLDKVKDQPTTPELMDLFTEYKSQEPAPDRPTPGFKEPRRMKIEYLTAQADSPYYKAWAEAAKCNMEKFYVSAPAGGNLMGGVAPLATLAGFLTNDPLQAEYDAEAAEKYKTAHAAAAYLTGAGVGPFAALSAPPIAYQAGELQDAPTRERLAVAALLAGDGSIAGSPYAGVGLPIAALPAPFARDETLRQLEDKRQKERTGAAVVDDVVAFGEELDKLKNDPEKAKDTIQTTVKTHGWDFQDKAGLDDRYALNDDPALQPLKAVVAPENGLQTSQTAGALSKLLFDSDQVKAGVYQFLGPIPDGSDKWVAFWRSEDKRSQELSFDEAEPRVREAWKLQKARVLALREANRIETEAAAQANPDEARKKLVDQKLGDVFELPGVARLVPNLTATQGVTADYHRFTVPADKIPAAPADLLDRLMTLDKAGKTLLFKDGPAKRFYVAVLEERLPVDMKDPTGFKLAYDDATLPQKNQLWHDFYLVDRQLEADKQSRRPANGEPLSPLPGANRVPVYHEELMRQLRADAGPVNDKGEWLLANKQEPDKQARQPQQSNPVEGGEGFDFGD